MTWRYLRSACASAVLALSLTACASGPPVNTITSRGASDGTALFSLTIAHLNDTHSHLDPSPVKTSIGGKEGTIFLGGFARLATLARSSIAGRQGIFLHAGDAFQGTLYFTKFGGMADVEMLNLLKVDAMTPGNHEFDRGPAVAAELADYAQFPLVAANMDVQGDPALKGKIRPYHVITVGKERIGVIGLACVDTPAISRPGPSVHFLEPLSSVAQSVEKLTVEGIDKIILLSHNGYEFDKDLAERIDGLDVIVGGHSHTLLGEKDLTLRGLFPQGPYPTVVTGPSGKKVLVVTAWEWGKILGVLDVRFDGRGEVVDYTGRPLLVDQTVPEDPVAAEKLARFRKGIEELERTVVAAAATDLPRYQGGKPVLGRLVARAMLWKARAFDPSVSAAFQNGGGVRADIPAGNISVGTFFSVLPFENTLVVVGLRGDQIREAIEESAAAARQGKIRSPLISDGFRYDLDAEGRPASLEVRGEEGQWLPLEESRTYRIVTSSYMAAGGDFTPTFTKAFYRRELPVTDTEAFRDFGAKEKVLLRPEEKDAAIFMDTALPRYVELFLRDLIPVVGASAELSAVIR